MVQLGPAVLIGIASAHDFADYRVLVAVFPFVFCQLSIKFSLFQFASAWAGRVARSGAAKTASALRRRGYLPVFTAAICQRNQTDPLKPFRNDPKRGRERRELPNGLALAALADARDRVICSRHCIARMDGLACLAASIAVLSVPIIYLGSIFWWRWLAALRGSPIAEEVEEE